MKGHPPSSICICGGTGSFGSALVKKLLTLDVQRVVVLSRGEHRQAQLRSEIGNDRRVRWFIGDVRDEERLRQAFYACDVVVNAAAIKRIEVASRHAEEAIKTNVTGHGNVLRAATAEGVARVLLVSSDKACAPAVCYGATKLMAEHLTVAWNVVSYPKGTRASAVRWGNVLGSAGSVLHIFREAIERGGPVPITDPDMTRFWIRMDDAVTFCLDAIEDMRGGEIFVPFLKSASVYDLFLAMRGDREAIQWTQVGVRDGGEKTHEALISEAEADRTVGARGGFVIEPTWEMPAERERWKGWPLTRAFTSDRATRLTHKEIMEAIG